jgi:hypothetical protein
MRPAWSGTPAGLLSEGSIASAGAKISLATDGRVLLLEGDDSRYGKLLVSAPIGVERNTDYLVRLPARILEGRMTVSISREETDSPDASVIVEPQDWKTPAEQPESIVELPFVSGDAGQVRLVFASGGSRPSVEVGQVELYALGPTAYTWTRFPRALVHSLQRLFITALMLPLAIIGLILLGRMRRGRALVILLVVPAYYLCVQSALHTEYRYVLAIHYFLFALAAVPLSEAGRLLRRALLRTSLLQHSFPRLHRGQPH